MNVEQAKKVLTDAGFYVGNLWSINDISEGTPEERMNILERVLDSEYIQGEIIEAIEREG
jgi:hypothetical protein